MSVYQKPLPAPADANDPHWRGAARGVLMVQRCEHCWALRYPAAPICARCRQAGASWVEVDPWGTVESYCVFHKAYWPSFEAELPYTVLVVRLDAGLRLYSNPVGFAPERVRIGQRVVAVFERVREDVGLVKFRPDSGGER